jgi:hypothetical protein
VSDGCGKRKGSQNLDKRINAEDRIADYGLDGIYYGTGYADVDGRPFLGLRLRVLLLGDSRYAVFLKVGIPIALVSFVDPLTPIRRNLVVGLNQGNLLFFRCLENLRPISRFY